MRFIKSIVSMMLVSVFVFTSMITSNALEGKELESGIYELENDVYHEQEIGISMARTYLKPTMKLEKRDNKFYYTVEFTGTDYMENYRVVVNGEEATTYIVSENAEEKSIELRFEVSEATPDMTAKIYVDAMGRDVEFEIIPKEDSIKLIEKIEEPKEKVQKEDVKTSTEDNKGKDSNNTALILIGAVAVIAIVIFIFTIVRKK